MRGLSEWEVRKKDNKHKPFRLAVTRQLIVCVGGPVEGGWERKFSRLLPSLHTVPTHMSSYAQDHPCPLSVTLQFCSIAVEGLPRPFFPSHTYHCPICVCLGVSHPGRKCHEAGLPLFYSLPSAPSPGQWLAHRCSIVTG